jgi:hypothetical protein
VDIQNCAILQDRDFYNASLVVEDDERSGGGGLPSHQLLDGGDGLRRLLRVRPSLVGGLLLGRGSSASTAGRPCGSGRPSRSPGASATSTWSRRTCTPYADSRRRRICSGGATPPPPWPASIRRRARGCSDAVRSWLAAVQMRRRARGNCSPEWLWLAAAHSGARVASEGLDPHSHLHPLFVGGGGVGLVGPVFCRYGPARIRGQLDGPFCPHPLSHRNNTGYQRFEGPARHALKPTLWQRPKHFRIRSRLVFYK